MAPLASIPVSHQEHSAPVAKRGIAATILRAPFTAQTWRHTAYGLLAFPPAVVYFALVAPGMIASTVLTIIFGLGIPLFLAFFAISRYAAAFERGRVRLMLGIDVGAPAPLLTQGGPVRRWKERCRSASTWRIVAFMILNVPVSFAVLFLCFYPWLQTVYSLTYPIMHFNDTFSEAAWGGPTWAGAVAVHSLPGIPALFLSPWVVRATTALHVKWVKLMLG